MQDFIKCIYSAILLPASCILHRLQRLHSLEGPASFQGGGRWATFPKNARVAHPALLNLESRACACLDHSINLDRQPWETSSLHDNQKHTRAAGHLFMLITSPRVWKLTLFDLADFLCWLKNCLLIMCWHRSLTNVGYEFHIVGFKTL